MNANAIEKAKEQGLTMSSREIAELTGKELYHVHRDIRAMMVELEKDDSVLSHEKDEPNLDHPKEDKDSRGYTTCFHLNRELTETLLTGYSAILRRKVIRRWHELEDQKSGNEILPDMTNPKIAKAMSVHIEKAAKEIIENQKLKERKRIEKERSDRWNNECNKFNKGYENLMESFVFVADAKLQEVIRREAFSESLLEYGKLLMSTTKGTEITIREQVNYDQIAHKKMEKYFNGMIECINWRELRDFIFNEDVKGFEEDVRKSARNWAKQEKEREAAE
jgi:phage regulator Rha-like protein